jgi:SP family xylose:H+ symportor-like MFS transporter
LKQNITERSAVPATTHFNVGYVLLITLVAALGGLLFGYDWVVIGGAKPFYERYFGLSSAQLIGWANSCALLGCLLGSVVSGALSDRIGRKKMLIAAALLFAVSSILTGWSNTFTLFVSWRIAGGVAIGVASNLSPTYISEVSPAPWRGRLVAIYQLGIGTGVVVAQVVNWLIAQKVSNSATDEMIRLSWNGQFGWRWMFSAVAIPALIFFLGALFLPESPRWLAVNEKSGEARKTLSKIGGDAYAEAALQEIRETAELDFGGRSPWQELLRPHIAKIVGIGVFLAVLQQFCGINVIFNYAEEIYRAAGYGVSGVMLNIVATGAIGLATTLIAFGLVDKFGRRPLMLFGCIAVGILHVLIGLSYHFGLQGLPPLLLTLAAIGCYGISLAPITWVLIAEIFPNRIRGTAVSIAVSALWIACFAVTFTFPLLNSAIGLTGTFWVFAGVCFAGFLFVLRFVPETKGKSLEEIEKELAIAG